MTAAWRLSLTGNALAYLGLATLAVAMAAPHRARARPDIMDFMDVIELAEHHEQRAAARQAEEDAKQGLLDLEKYLPTYKAETMLHDALYNVLVNEFEDEIRIPGIRNHNNFTWNKAEPTAKREVEIRKLEALQKSGDKLSPDDERDKIKHFSTLRLGKAALSSNDMMCLPPLRIYAEALETFFKFSGGRQTINQDDLVKAYNRSFHYTVDIMDASKMLRSLRINKREEGPKSLLRLNQGSVQKPKHDYCTRCEFVYAYLSRRGFIPHDMTSDFEPTYSAHKYWTLTKIFGVWKTEVSSKWFNFLDELYNLDNPLHAERTDPLRDESHFMTKCEVKLVLAMCRHHVGNHYLAPPHDPAHIRLKGEEKAPAVVSAWEEYRQRRVFPVSRKSREATFKEVQIRLEKIFKTNDLDGVGSLSRQQFANMIKDMDIWHDLQQYRESQDEHENEGPEGASFKDFKDYLNVDMLVDIQLKAEDVNRQYNAMELDKIWSSLVGATGQRQTGGSMTIQMGSVQELFERSGMDPEHAAESAKEFLYNRGEYGVEGISKTGFFKALLTPPEVANHIDLFDLQKVAAMTFGCTNETLDPDQKPRLQKYITKADYPYFMALLRMFSSMMNNEGRADKESFRTITKILPRVRRSPLLQDDKIEETFENLTRPGSKWLEFHEFAGLFTDPDFDHIDVEIATEEDVNVNAKAKAKWLTGLQKKRYPHISENSFVKVPVLEIPMTGRSLKYADRNDELSSSSRFWEIEGEETVQDEVADDEGEEDG